jgi:hypothetical protein
MDQPTQELHLGHAKWLGQAGLLNPAARRVLRRSHEPPNTAEHEPAVPWFTGILTRVRLLSRTLVTMGHRLGTETPGPSRRLSPNSPQLSVFWGHLRAPETAQKPLRYAESTAFRRTAKPSTPVRFRSSPSRQFCLELSICPDPAPGARKIRPIRALRRFKGQPAPGGRPSSALDARKRPGGIAGRFGS